jgi:hypothetical protein
MLPLKDVLEIQLLIKDVCHSKKNLKLLMLVTMKKNGVVSHGQHVATEKELGLGN